jgi:hypothetical protein
MVDGDRVAGDAQFADRPDTTVVGTDLAAVKLLARSVGQRIHLA